MASTLDQANQYPNVAIGPASEKYLRQPSLAYMARPPGLSGNMPAGAEYTYAWRAPTSAETNHRIAATLAPSAPTEKPIPTIRKPGFARPITNPSYQRIVFSRRRSSTETSATKTSSNERPYPRSRGAPTIQLRPIACNTFQAVQDAYGDSDHHHVRVRPRHPDRPG